jgi:hypothetical protein
MARRDTLEYVALTFATVTSGYVGYSLFGVKTAYDESDKTDLDDGVVSVDSSKSNRFNAHPSSNLVRDPIVFSIPLSLDAFFKKYQWNGEGGGEGKGGQQIKSGNPAAVSYSSIAAAAKKKE